MKKYGGLFISDEVQTGFGRTGKKWFGIEHWEVTPDIMTCAKGMANGVPIGATITTNELAGTFQGLTISTFGGNPVTSVAARAVIEVIEEENLRENTHVVGGYFRSKLEELQQKYPLIGDVRGMGLMQALELVKDRADQRARPAEATPAPGAHARNNGLLIGKGGLLRQRDPPGAADEHLEGRRGRRHPAPRQIFQRSSHLNLTRERDHGNADGDSDTLQKLC